MHHYPHHIGDYAAATAHLTFVEDAAYSRLLRLYYRDESPLPADLTACQRLAGARSTAERRAVVAVLEEFFSLGDDGWHQKRADKELGVYKERAEKARKNGGRGGRPGKTPAKHGSDETDPVISGLRKHNPAITDPVISGFPKHNPDVTQTKASEKLTGNRKEVEEEDSDSSLAVTESGTAREPASEKIGRNGRSAAIEPGWQPSASAMSQLRTSRPDLDDATIERRTVEFHAWCAETNKTTFNPEATWLGFMVKTHAQPDPTSRRPANGSAPTVADGIAAAFARRSVPPRG